MNLLDVNKDYMSKIIAQTILILYRNFLFIGCKKKFLNASFNINSILISILFLSTAYARYEISCFKCQYLSDIYVYIQRYMIYVYKFIEWNCFNKTVTSSRWRQNFIRASVLFAYYWGIMVILPSIEIYMGCTDVELNVDCLMLISCGTIGKLKMILFCIYANNLTDNYGSALNDYLTIKNGNLRSVMPVTWSQGRIICCFMISSCYISCIIISLA